MAYKIGVITLGSTGNKTFNLGTSSAPYAISFIVQNKTGTAEAAKHVSIGNADSSSQRVTSYYKDSTSSSTFDSTSKCIAHYERVSGAVTEVLSAAFLSFTGTGFSINVTKANVNYDVYVRADY